MAQAGVSGARGSPSAPAEGDRTGRRLAWMREARLGMFIHWGLYCLSARHEWVRQRERLSDDDYRRYFDHFDPHLFDPEQWATLAARAGMKYVVVTTKHHEGFCLWDSALTDYKAPNTPAGRDLLGPIVDAFRAHGLRIGFYHSLLDWHHPDFPIDGLHPQRDDQRAIEAASGGDLARYTEYLHGQVEEVLSGYGAIDYLFFDFSYPDRVWGGKGREAWASEELLAKVRQLQPNIVVNERLDINGDVVTPEQYQPQRDMGSADHLWEACQTLNGSWGYDRDNLDWKSPDLIVKMLVDGVSKDGNLLLNVGPTARGQLEPKAIRIFEAVGDWMSLHGRSIYGAGPSRFQAPPDCRYTQRGDRLYLHVLSWPFRHLHLAELGTRIDYAQLLNDGAEISIEVMDPKRRALTTTPGGVGDTVLTLTLPVQRPEVMVPLIELFLR
jgi:alpha-L-fucosidase